MISLRYMFFFLLLVLTLTYGAKEVFASPDPPLREDDAYADYVLAEASRAPPMSLSEINELITRFETQLETSSSYLVDIHTLNVIEDLVIMAIRGSETFRRMIAFSNMTDQISLGELQYRNIYETRDEEDSIDHVDGDDILGATADTVPIVINSALGEDSEDIPYANISVAPNFDSPYFPHYQESVIHEIVHALTHSNDPNRDNVHGPTELLAQRVIDELNINYSIHQFPGYNSPERLQAITARNYISLTDLLRRSENDGEEALNRLAILSREDRSVDPLYTRYTFFTQLQTGFNVLTNGLVVPDVNNHLHDFLNNQLFGHPTPVGILPAYRLTDELIAASGFSQNNGALVSARVRVSGLGLRNVEDLTQYAFEHWMAALRRLEPAIPANLSPDGYTPQMHQQILVLHGTQSPRDVLIRNIAAGVAIQVQGQSHFHNDSFPTFLYTSVSPFSIESVTEWQWNHPVNAWRAIDTYHVPAFISPLEPVATPDVSVPEQPLAGATGFNITVPTDEEIVDIVDQMIQDYSLDIVYCSSHSSREERALPQEPCAARVISASLPQPSSVLLSVLPIFLK